MKNWLPTLLQIILVFVSRFFPYLPVFNWFIVLSLKETAALLALDLISFKKAVQNLNAAANEMHRLKGVEANFGDKPAGNNFDKALKGKSFLNPNPKGIYLFPSQTRPKPLLSVKARYDGRQRSGKATLIFEDRDMLVDQMGLIRLLDEELPVIINLTDTFNSHVFNVRPIQLLFRLDSNRTTSPLASESTRC